MIGTLCCGRCYNVVVLQGVCVPAVQAMLAQWAPPLDRTVMVAYTYSGKDYHVWGLYCVMIMLYGLL